MDNLFELTLPIAAAGLFWDIWMLSFEPWRDLVGLRFIAEWFNECLLLARLILLWSICNLLLSYTYFIEWCDDCWLLFSFELLFSWESLCCCRLCFMVLYWKLFGRACESIVLLWPIAELKAELCCTSGIDLLSLLSFKFFVELCRKLAFGCRIVWLLWLFRIELEAFPWLRLSACSIDWPFLLVAPRLSRILTSSATRPSLSFDLIGEICFCKPARLSNLSNGCCLLPWALLRLMLSLLDCFFNPFKLTLLFMFVAYDGLFWKNLLDFLPPSDIFGLDWSPSLLEFFLRFALSKLELKCLPCDSLADCLLYLLSLKSWFDCLLFKVSDNLLPRTSENCCFFLNSGLWFWIRGVFSWAPRIECTLCPLTWAFATIFLALELLIWASIGDELNLSNSLLEFLLDNEFECCCAYSSLSLTYDCIW